MVTTDLTGLAGGSAPTPNAEGGVVAADSGTPDAGVGDSSSVRAFCETARALVPPPTYCNDFDDGNGLSPTPLTPSVFPQNGGGSLLVDSAISLSPPGSLHARAPARPNSFDSAGLDGEIGRVTRFLRIELDVLPLSLPADNEQGTYLVDFVIGDGNDPDRYQIAVFANATRTALAESEPSADGFEDKAWTRPLRLGVWTHVVINLDLLATASRATVTTQEPGEASAVEVLAPSPLKPGWTRTGETKARFGIVYSAGPHGPLDVQLDNLLVVLN